MDYREYEYMDQIFIEDLLIRCIIGIFPEERVEKQDILLSLRLYTDFRSSAASDDIDDTVSYKEIQEELMDMVESSSFQLVEALAEECARLCLTHRAVRAVRLRVDKPTALKFNRSVGVEIFRTSEAARPTSNQ